MKTILHQMCNSKISPVLKQDWDGSISATLSTFYAAYNLLVKCDAIFLDNQTVSGF